MTEDSGMVAAVEVGRMMLPHGANYRQLDHWVTEVDGMPQPVFVSRKTGEQHAVSPAGGSGYSRMFTVAQVADLVVVAQLVELGWQVAAVGRMPPAVRSSVLAAIQAARGTP